MARLAYNRVTDAIKRPVQPQKRITRVRRKALARRELTIAYFGYMTTMSRGRVARISYEIETDAATALATLLRPAARAALPGRRLAAFSARSGCGSHRKPGGSCNVRDEIVWHTLRWVATTGARAQLMNDVSNNNGFSDAATHYGRSQAIMVRPFLRHRPGRFASCPRVDCWWSP